jgi:hypothetical protein
MKKENMFFKSAYLYAYTQLSATNSDCQYL